MSKFVQVLLKILTLGIYGRGKTVRVVKKYDDKGQLILDKNVSRDYDFSVDPKDVDENEPTLS